MYQASLASSRIMIENKSYRLFIRYSQEIHKKPKVDRNKKDYNSNTMG